MGVAFDSKDETDVPEDTDPPADPEPTPDPDVVLDTGATFERTEDGVTIDVGEDETGTLVVFYYTDAEDSEGGIPDSDEARFYLVPEGVDWSGTLWDDNRAAIPGADTHYVSSDQDYELADFEAAFGLELIGVVSILPYGADPHPEIPSARIQVGEITSNVPYVEYYLSADTIGDELVNFHPVDYVYTYTGISALGDTTGTDADDRITAFADGITVDGAGGDDRLYTSRANVTLIGGLGNDAFHANDNSSNVVVDAGEGNDFIYSYGDTTTVDGGSGNDIISINNGTATGGEGDDLLHVQRTNYLLDRADGRIVLLYGEDGDDTIVNSGDGSQSYGGQGNDTLTLIAGAVGHGGDGNDSIRVIGGTTAFGDDSDDLFIVPYTRYEEDGPAVLTGGAGADTFEIYEGNSGIDDISAIITDFDLDEDVLQATRHWSHTQVDHIEIFEADDGSYTDVRAIYTGGDHIGQIASVIRLQGITGITADQIVMMG